jgi:transcriptional regulator with XRE-family HTH domain
MTLGDQLDSGVIGRRIRDERVARGITLPQLAAAAGMSKGYLWNIETHHELRSGTPAPKISLDVLARVLAPLGLSVGEFLSATSIASAAGSEFPEGFAEFLAQRASSGGPVPPGDVEMLMSVRMRGKRPRTPEGWATLYDALRPFLDEEK